MAGRMKTNDQGVKGLTDLFALNAVFEAARAGEAGAEFAVSAAEFRKRALKPTEATQKARHRPGSVTKTNREVTPEWVVK